MNKLLKDLYDCFYVPPELPAQKQEIEECHQSLIEVLDKPERRLVLQIIDAKDRIVEDTSIDSFISGFELAWRLSAELNQYEKERSISRCTARRSSVLSVSGKMQNEETNRRCGSIRRLSGHVCRCVASERTNRGNTRTTHATRCNRRTARSSGDAKNRRSHNTRERKGLCSRAGAGRSCRPCPGTTANSGTSREGKSSSGEARSRSGPGIT